MPSLSPQVQFPVDPLDQMMSMASHRRTLISGILDSYHGNYDCLMESVQNAVDALEDAALLGLGGPLLLEVTVNLKENSFSVLDTGTGMSEQDLILAYKPHVSLKTDVTIRQRRGKTHSYRGYKGVGLTFLAYGTDRIRLHSKKHGHLTKTRMEYGHAWAQGQREEPARVDIDPDPSPLETQPRGTFVKVHFSPTTLPRSLAHLGRPEAWPVIVRTRTAAGQVLLGRESLADLRLVVSVTRSDGTVQRSEVAPEFILPHQVPRTPPFRFLDVVDYHRKHREQAEPAPEHRRQDGLYLVWDTQRITEELTEKERTDYAAELRDYTPHIYAFVPYQGSVWNEMNRLLSGVENRSHLDAGLVVAINRQRLADVFEMDVTRYEAFSRNVFALVHFDDAPPDQGRKTVQGAVLSLAKAAANRAVQYLAKQRAFLKPPGEAPTPLQRQVELHHQDWVYNVRKHAENNPLHVPPIAYASTPLTEQDVVGLFHQFCVMGVFPGIRVFATSQVHTYDCLLRFQCPRDVPGVVYCAPDRSPLGVMPFVAGDQQEFRTADLTAEFKNNIDGLIDEMEDPSRSKDYRHIDLCVCWSRVSDRWAGYDLSEVSDATLEQRMYPGVTHLLHREGEAHVIQVVMLETVTEMVRSGRLGLAPPDST